MATERCLSENDVFMGKKMTTINVEIPETLNARLIEAHQDEISAGFTSLTFEQYVGGLINLGYSWATYIKLKRVFDK